VAMETTSEAGPWTVLLLARNLVDQKLLSGLLKKHHHQVFVVSDQDEALQRLAKSPPDVFLLDLSLVDDDSGNRIQAIQRQAPSSVVVVVLVDDPDNADLLRPETVTYLSRPINIVEFHAAVLAARWKQSPKSPRIDWRVAWEAVGGRRDLLEELIQIFDSEYPNMLEAIRSAATNGDAKQLQGSAHQLKGCLRYFGTTEASEIARRLEDIGRSRQLDGAVELIEPLNLAVQNLLPELKKGPT
jgi:HPt (histidine-containing phosphotransfer) domain-containing protein